MRQNTISVHLLGAGAMGTLITHALRKLPNPPTTTLLFRSQEKSHHFQTSQNGTLQVKKIYKTPHLFESTKHFSSYPGGVTEQIQNLIISTKTNQTTDAIKPYLPYISRNTNILLVQNGFGVSEELISKYWQDPTCRPNLFQGVINHSGYLTPNTETNSFEMTHSGSGDLFISSIPIDSSNSNHNDQITDMPAFIKSISSASELNTTLLSHSEMLIIRIRKFVSNVCSNSITAILDIKNHEIDVPETRYLYKEMISEIMTMFQKRHPDIFNPETENILGNKALLDFVLDVTINWHGQGTTSTRHDTLMGRKTEVEYLTGFVVREAQRLGVRCDTVKAITRLVRMRETINIKRKTS